MIESYNKHLIHVTVDLSEQWGLQQRPSDVQTSGTQTVSGFVGGYCKIQSQAKRDSALKSNG